MDIGQVSLIIAEVIAAAVIIAGLVWTLGRKDQASRDLKEEVKKLHEDFRDYKREMKENRKEMYKEINILKENQATILGHLHGKGNGPPPIR